MSESSESTARRNGWRVIVREGGRRRLGVATGVVTGRAWTAAKVSTGVIVRQAVDEGIERDDMTALRNWAVVLGCVALASAVFTGLRRYMAFREARAVEASLRDRIFAHVQRLHFAFHDAVHTGQIMSWVKTQHHQIQHLVVMVH